MSELEDQITIVRDRRHDLELETASLDALQKAFDSDNAERIARREAFKKEVAEEEAKLRELTIAAFSLDPTNKKPARGVGIRVGQKTTICYDPADALSWAKKRDLCLVLDTKVFEQIATITDLSSMGVEILTDEIVTATISKEL